MVPTYSLDEVIKHLRYPLERRPKKGASDARQMVGLLFARPDSPLAREEIVPSLNYFHHRSGDKIDFFCVGYGWFSPPNVAPDQLKVHAGGPNKMGWGFSARRFDEFRRDIERKTSWRYSGGTELLLTNALLAHDSQEVVLEWNSTIRCDLDRMKADGAIIGVHPLFEEVFRAADTASDDDPTWALSDAQGARVAGSGLKRLLLSLLPKSLGDDVRRAAHFAIADVGKNV